MRIYNHAVATTTATFDLEPQTVASRTAWFARFDDANPLLVCELDDASIAGFAGYTPYRDRPAYAATKETTIYVDARHARGGVATALYRELIAHARANGVHVLVAVLGGSNPASEALHRKLGFQMVGRLREVGRKFDAWVDTWFWQLTL